MGEWMNIQLLSVYKESLKLLHSEQKQGWSYNLLNVIFT